ncbi:MAG: metallophosphoesterase [Solirubrobacteraceae bacterium]
MITLVVSDLHLGARSGIDLLRGEPARGRLLEEAGRADEVILLGDVVELREGPMAEAMDIARPWFEALGSVLGERRVVITPGNHDHRLLERWRERVSAAGDGPLGLEQLIDPAQASDIATTIAGWLSPARLQIAYPGLWLADGVYAIHGHYLDRHITVPAFEPLAVRSVERVLRARGDRLEGVEGYEAVLAPLYAALHEVAQSAPAPRGRSRPTATLSSRAYRLLAGDGSGPRPLHHRLVSGIAFPTVVGALNAAGLGPLRADLTGPELRRSSLRAMAEVLDRLAIDAQHVIFGHTHRAGPLPGDDSAEWLAPGATRLHNCGSWVVERFLGGRTPERSPYRAGAAIRVESGRPTPVRHLLDGRAYAARA